MTKADQPHTMRLTETHPSGAEEWSCATCGRRFMLQWSPDYRKVILERGDENTFHNGGYGGVQVSFTQTQETIDDSSDQALDPWRTGLADIDLDT